MSQEYIPEMASPSLNGKKIYNGNLAEASFKEEQYRTQTGQRVTFKTHVHDRNLCKEFVIESAGLNYLKFIICASLFNLLGFSLELHTGNSYIMAAIIALLFIGILLKMHFKVTQESLLVIASLGVQTTTTFASGRQIARYHHISDIRDVVINEGITMHSVIYYLAILLRDKDDPQSVASLQPLFTSSWPSINCLQLIYQGIQSILFVDHKHLKQS